jgi:hypothetical protein
MNRTRKGLIAVGLLAAISTATITGVIAAGNWSTLPVVGGASYCASTVSGVNLPSSQGPFGVVPGSTQGSGSQGICGQTVPAGPTGVTGVEMIPADTGLANSASPQTAVIPSALLQLGGDRNKLIGGDFATNLWQRNLTPISSQTNTAYAIGADRWWEITATSGGTQVTVSKQTGTTDTISAQGLYASMRVARTNTNTGVVCIGQTLDKVAFQDFLGNNAIFSFYALAGAGFSPTASNLSVAVAYDTASDSTTPGTNTATSALSAAGQAGGIAGYQAAVVAVSPGTTGTVASGVATIPISTTWTRYAVAATIPSANTSGTAVTGGTVSICWTPVGTTTTNDYVEFEGMQLEAKPSTVTPLLANGVISPSGFQKRLQAWETSYQLAYSFVLTDNANTQIYAPGVALTSGTMRSYVQFPEQMRETPTLTVGTTISFGAMESQGSATTCGTSIGAVASSATLDGEALLCTTGNTLLVAGNGSFLIGAATYGLLTFSAEP